MYKLVRRILQLNILPAEQYRSASAWVNRARADPESGKTVDAEKLFINPEVQRLLTELTGMDLEQKVFKTRRTGIQQRSHYALMTDERLEKTMDKMREEAQRFLSLVPLKEPRSEEVTVLSRDPEIEGFDNSKFVFTDITFDATDQVFKTRRTGIQQRSHYALMTDERLEKNALDKREHEFVLDWACWFYEPDDPAYIQLVLRVFDRLVEAGDFDVLHSTRHFGTLVFYLALNGNIPPLLNFFGGGSRVKLICWHSPFLSITQNKDSSYVRSMHEWKQFSFNFSDCARLVRLQKILHPDWRFAINSSDSDLKIVTDFVKENSRYREQLKDLNAFLKDGTVIPSTSQNDEEVLVNSEDETAKENQSGTRQERRGRFRRQQSKPTTPKPDDYFSNNFRVVFILLIVFSSVEA
ncbi:hypothetical protein OSTOST_09011 [Ostertagia ostertagi]